MFLVKGTFYVDFRRRRLTIRPVPRQQPNISVNTGTYRSLAQYNGQYLVMMLDADAMTPTNPSLRFLLHWMQPNMTMAASAMGGMRQLTNMTAPVAPYLSPSPPSTSDAHRYILYAFQQPSNFTIPPAFSGYSASNRTKFNVTQFMSAAHLSEPAAAMYYFCSNKTGVPTNFIANAGGMYPGGDGAMVTNGPGPSATPAASSSGSMSSSATSSPSSSASGSSAAAGMLDNIQGWKATTAVVPLGMAVFGALLL